MKRRAQPWLGTLVDISIADDLSAVALANAFTAAFARIAEVHRLMSFHAPDSDVARINHAPVDSVVAVDAHTFAVIETALMLSRASDSIFNIGCATRLAQWDLLPRPTTALPEYGADSDGLAIVDDRRLRKTRPMLIDLGGIAKGYAVDQAISALQECGIVSACVNAGGDLRVLGKATFPIVIRNPYTITTAAREIALADVALATSASYFSRRESHEETVSALVDGRDGTAITSTPSFSVIAPTCMLADALTKIVAATGEHTHPLLHRFGASAFII